MKNLKIKFAIVVLILALTILIPSKTYAGIQANKGGKSLTGVSSSDFFTQIRTMEGTYGTLGVAPDTSTKANGIDAHMAKNTEWGTAAMLQISAYGSNSNSTATTTGNSSGIYYMNLPSRATTDTNKFEYTANYIEGNTKDFAANITNAASKYKNGYADSSTRIAGDALNLGTLSGGWSADYPVVIRGHIGLFNYSGATWSNDWFDGGGSHNKVSSRACVVMGTGL